MQSTPSCFLAVALGVAELGHRVVGEHDQLHGRPLLAADGTPDACGAAAPTMNIAAALSCTAAAVRQVAGPDTASEGSWERSPGAVSDGPSGPAAPLLLPVSWWTRPALDGKPSSEKDPSEFVPFSSSLSSSDPSESSSISSLHSRCEGRAAPEEEPPTGSAQRRWQPPGGHSLRAQLQRKRLRVPTPSLRSETKNKGAQNTPY